MNILVIDDSRSIHAFVTECFTGIEVKITHAYNGKEGVEKYLATPQEFDLILLDWEMPVMTGPQAFNELKAKGVSIPVMMMTSKNAVDDIATMLEAGVSEYVMKPYTQDILIEKIEQVTGKSLSGKSAA